MEILREKEEEVVSTPSSLQLAEARWDRICVLEAMCIEVKRAECMDQYSPTWHGSDGCVTPIMTRETLYLLRIFLTFSLSSPVQYPAPNEGWVFQRTETIVKTRDESTADVLCERFFYLNERVENTRRTSMQPPSGERRAVLLRVFKLKLVATTQESAVTSPCRHVFQELDLKKLIPTDLCNWGTCILHLAIRSLALILLIDYYFSGLDTPSWTFYILKVNPE